MTKHASWQTATIASGGTATAKIDLKDNYQYVNIILPTLTSCNITITMTVDGTTFIPIGSGVTITASTGGFMATATINGARYIKLTSSQAQESARSLLVAGWNP